MFTLAHRYIATWRSHHHTFKKKHSSKRSGGDADTFLQTLAGAQANHEPLYRPGLQVLEASVHEAFRSALRARHPAVNLQPHVKLHCWRPAKDAGDRLVITNDCKTRMMGNATAVSRSEAQRRLESRPREGIWRHFLNLRGPKIAHGD